MTKFGYTLFSETNGPKELVHQAQQAEDVGFDFAAISDHFHPWLSSHTDSPFAWSVLGGVAERTRIMELATLVTCPMIRYHPAIIAQAAATVQIMSDGRFTLSLGAGENLNEHVVGRGWPSVDIRHEMLGESIEAIRALWNGGYVTYRGKHVTVEDARIWSMPDETPGLAVAVSGAKSIELAVEHSTDMVAVDPDAQLVDDYGKSGGKGRRIGQVALSYDKDEGKARGYAMRFKFGAPGWKVMSELPNPINFDAATELVTFDDLSDSVATGPDPQVHAEAVKQFIDAGFDEVCVVQVGDDKEGFMRFWADEVAPLL
ncbi:LLM class F420-dependent oxidoreductase [soil metagenome]